MESAREDDFLYRFKKQDDKCRLDGFYKNVSGDKESARIIAEVREELGVVPGDALLSNSVIWVEGPSEVSWLRTWIRNYYPIYQFRKDIKANLLEGQHFSILMTGGNLIAHLTYDETNESDQINVLRVNPNPFVMMDSDLAAGKKRKRIQKIAKELSELAEMNPIFDTAKLLDDQLEGLFDLTTNRIELPNFWLLKGKELENYIHPQLLKDYVGKNKRSNRKLGKRRRRASEKAKISKSALTPVWDKVFSSTKGVGTLLQRAGIQGLSSDSGSIANKKKLTAFVAENWRPYHFYHDPVQLITDENLWQNLVQKGLVKNKEEIETIQHKPNSSMTGDLCKGLDRMFDFIVAVNGLK